jgi:phage terminase large subunit-like protein
LGVDIGGARAASAVVGVTSAMQVAEVHVFHGDGAVLQVVDKVLEIAGRRPVVEVAHDPWRFRSEALRLERDHGLCAVEVPMSSTRMGQASEGLHGVIVGGRLTHPDHPELNQHVANAIAKQTPRGWRLDKSGDAVQIDAVVALMIAVERADQPAPEPSRLLGWL